MSMAPYVMGGYGIHTQFEGLRMAATDHVFCIAVLSGCLVIWCVWCVWCVWFVWFVCLVCLVWSACSFFAS
ncbi:hypothetical protein GGR50DRAFT_645876 [Xylaria sp. CBS 124048]|nr:hypothetical protein GGR50DRAFT_645876 [Xylaria sp. CBS 124048]